MACPRCYVAYGGTDLCSFCEREDRANTERGTGPAPRVIEITDCKSDPSLLVLDFGPRQPEDLGVGRHTIPRADAPALAAALLRMAVLP